MLKIDQRSISLMKDIAAWMRAASLDEKIDPENFKVADKFLFMAESLTDTRPLTNGEEVLRSFLETAKRKSFPAMDGDPKRRADIAQKFSDLINQINALNRDTQDFQMIGHGETLALHGVQ